MNIKETIVNELHKPARRNFKRRRVIIKGLNDLLQADLIEMIPYANLNRGHKYILVVINAFSKFVWVEPLKSKAAKEVAFAMKKILTKIKPKMKHLQTDQGSEFFNHHFSKLINDFGIKHYNTYSNLKASIVERVNRTLKNLIWKEFSLQGNYKWLDILPNIIKIYNNTVHTTTGFKPSKVNKSNEKLILKKSFTFLKTTDPKKIKYKVGDLVRVSRFRTVFSKGYLPMWSNEIFIIDRIKLSNPTMYYLKAQNGEFIKGGFYEFEIQKVKYPNIYLVEKILRRKKNMLFVKWLGLSNSSNSWINKNDVLT